MGSTKEEQERVRSLLLDTVTLLCKNGLNFKKQLKVQGLLGITLDEDDVFIVHINEKVGELVVTQQKKDKHYEEDSDESSVDSPPAKVNRKRRSDSSPMYRGPPDKICIKTEKEEPDEDLILIEDHADDKSQIQRTLLQHQQPPGMHSVTNFQTGYQNYGHQNNMHGAPGYMTSPGAVNNTQQHTLPHQNITQTGQPTPEKQFYLNKMDLLVLEPKQLQPYKERSSTNKPHACDSPGCTASYHNKQSLRRHQTNAHGRPKRKWPKFGPFSFARSIGKPTQFANSEEAASFASDTTGHNSQLSTTDSIYEAGFSSEDAKIQNINNLASVKSEQESEHLARVGFTNVPLHLTRSLSVHSDEEQDSESSSMDSRLNDKAEENEI